MNAPIAKRTPDLTQALEQLAARQKQRSAFRSPALASREVGESSNLFASEDVLPMIDYDVNVCVRKQWNG
jgi:hypothetical protein